MAHSLHSQQPPESKHGEHNAPRKHTSVNALIGFVLVVIAAIFVMSVLSACTIYVWRATSITPMKR